MNLRYVIYKGTARVQTSARPILETGIWWLSVSSTKAQKLENKIQAISLPLVSGSFELSLFWDFRQSRFGVSADVSEQTVGFYVPNGICPHHSLYNCMPKNSRNSSWAAWLLNNKRSTGWPETSVRNHEPMLCKMPEERRPHSHRDGSLKSFMHIYFNTT
jgi:hypothetical protein